MPRKSSESHPDGPVVIKKYGNRRLYDTRQSKYITLEDLAGIVKSGTTVQVVDSTTSKDLTRPVLLQVLLEQQDSLEMVPVELLHALLRVQGTLEQAPFAAFLSAMTGQFVERGNHWAKQLVELMGGFPLAGMGGLGSMPGFGGDAPAGSSPEPSEEDTAAPPDAPVDGLHEVRNRMDALLNRMKK